MNKLLLRKSHTPISTSQFCRLYPNPRWPPLSHISTVRQYSSKPRRGLDTRIQRLRFALTSVFRGPKKRRQDEDLISKIKTEGECDPSPIAKTTPRKTGILYTIMDSIETLATGIKNTIGGTIPTTSLTDTPDAVIKLIDSLARSDLPTSPPSVYIDLEGIKIGRGGSISILQVYILPIKKSYLVDVHTLGEKAFSTPNSSGLTLKSILESQLIPKVFFDVRNDSDALYSLFGVKLGGVIDLQLMELATRSFSRDFVNGLAKCMDRDLVQSPKEFKFRGTIKKRGKELFAPELGGRYEVFNDRPLDQAIVDYCIQDVQLMPQLWEIYNAKFSKLHKGWATKLAQETSARISSSQSPGYDGIGRHKARAPRGW